MNDVTKLIEELEGIADPHFGGIGSDRTVADVALRAAQMLRDLTAPRDGIRDGEIPYRIIMELYNAAIQGTHLIPAKGMPAMRRRMIAQRWQEDKERQTIEWWTNYFKRIAASDFLAGRTPPSPGHENWRANFDWFIKPGKMTNVLEGQYDNRGSRTNTDQITRYR